MRQARIHRQVVLQGLLTGLVSQEGLKLRHAFTLQPAIH
ncbi:MAG: hypothetical protein ACI8W8_004355, partial [Rhodothermales bacterium]